ncbi:MAG: Mur ligase family protein, partial [Arenicellales bacterium]
MGDLLSGFASVSMDLALKPVESLALDSRNVVPGSLFFGVDGHKCRGQDFAREALNAGAVAAVVEGAGGFKRMSEGYCLQIENLKKKIGPIASRFFGYPSHTLCVIGVTGTNGKTSCSTLLAQALNLLGTRAAVIGTAGWGFPGDLAPGELTTPDPITLQSQFHSLVERGAQSVCLEVSSHALDQGRIEGTRFDTAAFTNLSHDHLDYHKTMEAYEQTKLLLFQRKELKHAVINIADAAGERFASRGMLCEVLTFGRDERADVYPLKERITDGGLSLTIATP